MYSKTHSHCFHGKYAIRRVFRRIQQIMCARISAYFGLMRIGYCMRLSSLGFDGRAGMSDCVGCFVEFRGLIIMNYIFSTHDHSVREYLKLIGTCRSCIHIYWQMELIIPICRRTRRYICAWPRAATQASWLNGIHLFDYLDVLQYAVILFFSKLYTKLRIQILRKTM